ncbi:hypothetical protein DFH08DRAFT_888635 [Mycena albidolilacea]|uniref:Uncharacterized protein n=1 Tax=Mycena albidolilacea TaxID=1033008 RepID=A0AAD6ZHH5_9AGAR|nr:hypothetical protein DFH08DRAFT_888635 [Mycena albidolilacea]
MRSSQSISISRSPFGSVASLCCVCTVLHMSPSHLSPCLLIPFRLFTLTLTLLVTYPLAFRPCILCTLLANAPICMHLCHLPSSASYTLPTFSLLSCCIVLQTKPIVLGVGWMAGRRMDVL